MERYQRYQCIVFIRLALITRLYVPMCLHTSVHVAIDLHVCVACVVQLERLVLVDTNVHVGVEAQLHTRRHGVRFETERKRGRRERRRERERDEQWC